MRALIQRVSEAGVSIGNELHSSIGKGLLILLGIETEDTRDDVLWLAQKIVQLRIFSDAEGKMNLDLKQVNGQLLVVSQFTLHAAYKKGNRPSYIRAARPEVAIPLYEMFIAQVKSLTGRDPACGVFGADMQVSLVNDGPVTILLDSKAPE